MKKYYYTPKKPRLPISDKPNHRFCTRCREEKHYDEFHNLKTGRDGKCAYCKVCAKSWSKEWIGDNREHINRRNNEKRKEYMANNPEYKLMHKLRDHVRRYIVDKRGKKTIDIVGCTIEEARKHIESQFVSGMSWDNHGEWHIDHIVPLSSGKNEEEYIKLNHYTNLQPLWKVDNLKKGAKLL